VLLTEGIPFGTILEMEPVLLDQPDVEAENSTLAGASKAAVISFADAARAAGLKMELKDRRQSETINGANKDMVIP